MRYCFAVVAAAIIALTTSLSAQPPYRLQANGEIWVARAETCGGQACFRWHLLDNDTDTEEITAGGTPGTVDPLSTPPATPLYQRRKGGTIWRYTGKPCGGGSCPGWELIDQNQRTASIVAAGTNLYQRQSNGAIWRYNDIGRLCISDGSCPGWERLDNNGEVAEIVAGGIPERTEIYQRRNDGAIWRFTGRPCNSDGSSCPGWERLDNNRSTQEITASVRKRSDGVLVQALYQRRDKGGVWHYTEKPCVRESCTGWEQIDNHMDTISIVATTDELYQLRRDRLGKGMQILVYGNKPCRDGSCPGWQLLDNSPRVRQIAAGTRSLYKVHDNGTIWRYAGCDSGEPCSPWQLLYDPATLTVVSTQN